MMNRVIKLVVLLGCTVATLAAQDQPKPRLSLRSGVFVPGRQLTFTYTPADGPLEDCSDIHAIVWTYDLYRWHVHDVDLEPQSNGKLRGSMHVSDSCGVVMFRFQHTLSPEPDIWDNGEDTYIYQATTIGAKPVCGYNIGLVVARAPSMGFGIPGWTHPDFRELHPQNVLDCLKQEMNSYQQYVPFFFNEMLQCFRYAYADAAQGGIRYLTDVLNRLDGKGEEDMLNLSRSLRQQLHEAARADSVDRAIRQSFPHGVLVRREALDSVMALDGAQFISSAEHFLRDFPLAEARLTFSADIEQYDALYHRLVLAHFRQGDYHAVERLLPQMDMTMLHTAYLSIHPLAESMGVAARSYQSLDAAFLQAMQGCVGSPANQRGYVWSPAQWRYLDEQRLQMDRQIYAHLHP